MVKYILVFLGVLGVLVVETPLCAADNLADAQAAFKSGDYERARKLADDYLDKNRKGAGARQARLLLADLEEKLEKAIDAYRALVDEKKDAVAESAQKGIAERFYLVSRYSEARENYGRFLILFPGSAMKEEVLFWYATCHVLLGETEKGMELFERLIKEHPGGKRVSWAELALAECLLKLERAAEAEKRLKGMLGSAAERQFGNLIHFHLGECYQKLGKHVEASKSYRKVVQDFPGSFEVDEAKRRLELMRVEHPGLVGESVSFSVQVGAFSSRANAAGLADKLKAKGFPAHTISEKTRGGTAILYRVRVGKYKTRAEAESQARMLESKEKLPGLVVEVGAGQ